MRTKNSEKTGVYGIFDGNNKCWYVGRGFLDDRKNYHVSRCRNQKHPNKDLQGLWNETKGALEFRVLKYCYKKDFQFYEDYYINEYDTINNGFNKQKASEYHYNTNTYKKKKTRELRSEINSGENNPRAVYTSEQIIELKIMVREGYGYQDIADKFGMSYGYVAQIANGYKWASVTDDEVDAAIKLRKGKSNGNVVELELEPLYIGFDANMNVEDRGVN